MDIATVHMNSNFTNAGQPLVKNLNNHCCRTHPAVDVASFKVIPTSIFIVLTAGVWYFMISSTSIRSVSPISVVIHSTTFVLHDRATPSQQEIEKGPYL